MGESVRISVKYRLPYLDQGETLHFVNGEFSLEEGALVIANEEGELVALFAPGVWLTVRKEVIE